MSSLRYLFSKGILSHTSDVPAAKVFLEAHPGAYTTSRTHDSGSCLMFWERHMKRLSESIRILSNLAPQLIFKSDNAVSLQPLSPNLPAWKLALQTLVNDSLEKVLPFALKKRVDSEELIITTLVTGNLEKLNACETISEEKMSKFFDVHVHIETYVPPQFGILGNGEHLAVGGYGRNVAAAKYSDWVRIRKTLEKLRPPSVTELLLSYNGNQILEGSATNFFVVCRKDSDSDDGKSPCDYGNKSSFEVQTAPISDGVLPGIIRQLVLEACRSEGISCREVAPSWSKHEIWEEAFITNSLRILQHVDSIQVPIEWQSAHSKTWKDISWTKKEFKVDGPGMITTLIQEKVMEKAILEGYPISNICTR
ncbi:putative aminotransferase class IV [Medicago truncatula]|uniref:Putative aminotransferase class IV n=1 Tax=Medicago truncatula TaxID=3880 RepID=A0A396JUP4_MEDTR|nr:putative aminotransferase class IV [Medicago truncatula]